MKIPALKSGNKSGQKNILLYQRWVWHGLFWIGYILFRFWLYYITLTYYPKAFLEYMLLSEILFVGMVYFTLLLYHYSFQKKKYAVYFSVGTAAWIAYLWGRTVFQFYYLEKEPAFRGNTFSDIFLNNITVVIVYFLFITACKYFKDGYISQQFESTRKQQQLMAEVNNLKSQIAPHFLFNTLNNLYGLAVDKSDKLPGLMLRLSDLLRHSLYETQQPQVALSDEINILKSYIELERIRLEDDLELTFHNNISNDPRYRIAPLILIVFIENAFKHSKFIQTGPVKIHIKSMMDNGWFIFTVKNNYNQQAEDKSRGIGLVNVKRRLEVLYPLNKHELIISNDETFYFVTLKLQLDNLTFT